VPARVRDDEPNVAYFSCLGGAPQLGELSTQLLMSFIVAWGEDYDLMRNPVSALDPDSVTVERTSLDDHLGNIG
jgi:hypothetical protein